MSLRRRLLLGALILALAAGLRLPALGRASLWMDEAGTWDMARHSPAQLLPYERMRGETNPPVYFWLAILAGGRHASEAALRLPAALAGLATVALFLAWRRPRRWAGEPLLAALLVAVSARNVADSREARAYALLALLAAGLVWALERWLERPGGRRLAAVAALEVAAFYTHLMAVPLILALNLWVVLRSRRLFGDALRPRLAAWLAAQAAAAALCLPWLLAMRGSPSYPYPPTLPYLLSALAQIHFSYTLPLPTLALVILGVAASAAAAWGVAGQEAVSELWWIYLFGSLAATAALSALPGKGIFLPRYFSFLVPAFAAGVAGLGGRAWMSGRRPARAAAAVGIAAWVILNLWSVAAARTRPEFQGQDWRALAARLRQQAGPGDLVLVQPAMATPALQYYLRAGGPEILPVNQPGPGLLDEIARTRKQVWLAFLPANPLVRATRLDRMMTRRFHLVSVWQNRVAYPFDLVVLLRYRIAAPSPAPRHDARNSATPPKR